MTDPQGLDALMQSQERRLVQMPTNLDEQGHPVCPYCGCNKSKVTNPYPWQNALRRRRRVCDNCKNSFYTVQPAEQLEKD